MADTVFTKGTVTFDLAGEPVTLAPTVKAFNLLSSVADSYSVLLQRLAVGHVDTIKTVLRAGLGLNDTQVKELPGKIMLTGVFAVANPCSDYVYRLFNAGKSVKEVQEEQQAKAAAQDEAEEAGDAEDEENPPHA
ncbi:hypothetical protein GAY33_09455 [Azospirillum brasilense]|uniref:hypothetical protein n=1 Tax=Azospirillum argentinense TaxID=2970906 RepID=UPI00190E093A|nr:hypothetical protein [Azospirillum argentinense]MBK3799449.1 hypothetical protein [Azospirillum argentinense]